MGGFFRNLPARVQPSLKFALKRVVSSLENQPALGCSPGDKEGAAGPANENHPEKPGRLLRVEDGAGPSIGRRRSPRHQAAYQGFLITM